MELFRSVDKPLLYAAITLLIGGLLILASASMVMAQKNFGNIGYYAMRQLLYGGLGGVVAGIAAMAMPYRLWKKLAVPLLVVSLLLLALVFIPEISYTFGGARRWLTLGPVSFQPSEILKLTFIIYLASWLDSRRRDIASVSYGLIPFSLMLAIVGIFLAMQPDIGTLGTIVASAGMLYFLGGGKISQIITLSTFGLVIFYFLILIAPYRLSRILVFLNPGLDPQGAGYQINQALIAIGSGGFTGLGFGRGIQKYNYLPEPMTDSIFASFAEELGFIGVLLLVALFCFFIWRGLLIAKRAPDVFGKLLAAGISVCILTQVFVNMAAISGLLPLTGIPLPFISYGGTSLAITLAGVGILLNISKHA